MTTESEPSAPPAEAAADTAPRNDTLQRILESLLLASELPLSLDQLHRLVGPELGIGRKEIREGLDELVQSLQGRAAEVVEVASGYRIQVRKDYAEWVSRLWQEKPPKLSRALLETLAIMCYRQPVTRGEVEEIRGVALSPNIIRVLLDRNWIREVGVKEVPGRPALFGTTQQLLDDLNVKSIDELPQLPDIKDAAQLEAALAKLAGQMPPTESAAEPAGDESETPTIH
ncbi:MAG TPA: SMC-Scp complex subunit ScpB [Solimonas sp.]|nr:SMC-Scp complex subunit ScpB [Solimonas sp.]